MKISAGIVAGFALSAVFAASTQADILANWTFEAPNTPGDITNNGTGPTVNASGGVFVATSVATGLHISANTDWTTPVGNGSLESLSSNEWAIGDYYQFSTSSTAYTGISISWDQTGSATGPRDFVLQYSTDNVTYNTFVSYQMTSPAVSWSSVTPVTTTSYSFDLSSIAALNNDSSIFFRFAMNTTTSINGGTVATAGTNRVDNIVISAAVPAPGAIALVGLAVVIGARSRRR